MREERGEEGGREGGGEAMLQLVYTLLPLACHHSQAPATAWEHYIVGWHVKLLFQHKAMLLAGCAHGIHITHTIACVLLLAPQVKLRVALCGGLPVYRKGTCMTSTTNTHVGHMLWPPMT